MARLEARTTAMQSISSHTHIRRIFESGRRGAARPIWVAEAPPIEVQVRYPDLLVIRITMRRARRDRVGRALRPAAPGFAF
jgi:hypothetical protein